MEIKYDAKTDMMYIRFNNKKVHMNEVTADDSVVLDLAEDDTVVGIELISPSRYVDNVEEMAFRYTAKDAPAPGAGSTG
ncbi:MAG: DUF2283 domain-containing protein [Chloroflexi bacterium]|nr:DUF2283 domain-containing protein [Chloroflexota bacterium]